jgi:mono/diheme cytochrome c family protein
MDYKSKFILLTVFFVCVFSNLALSAEGEYVGSETCASCHEQEYNNFTKYSEKSDSWEHILKMKPKLTEQEFEECFECHTTGYKRGGFVSYQKTPELANVGCETCHGPGLKHAQSGGDPGLIKANIDQKDCKNCHNDARVEDFDFKPLIYGGVH